MKRTVRATTRPRWLDRTVLRAPYFALLLSESEYHAEMRRLGIPGPWPEWVSAGANATTHTLHNPSGNACCYVCLEPSKAKASDTNTLLVHEAVHVWQVMEKQGDLDGEETEAYSIQTIGCHLIEEYAMRTKAAPRAPRRAKGKGKSRPARARRSR